MEEESATEDTAVSAFDRVFNVTSRARRELVQAGTSNENLLATTRRLFRRSRNRLSGIPVDDVGREKVSQIQLNWTLADFKQFICQSFPNVSLNLTGYEVAKADRGKNLKKVQFTSVKELKRALGRSRLYILPLAELSQESSPLSPSNNSERASSSQTAPSEVLQQCRTLQQGDECEEVLVADRENEPSPPLSLSDNSQRASSSQTAPSEVLQHWRALRQQQDSEYEQSLIADQEKERRRQCLEAQEKIRLKAIEDRHQRIINLEEPIDGVPIKFKFPNGLERIRKFNLSETIQVLFDFVGQDDLSSEVFYVQEATSSTPLKNNLSGTLNDYNIKGFSTLYVVWTSSEEAPSLASPHEPSTSVQSACHTPSPPHWSPAPSPPHWSPASSPSYTSTHWSPVHFSPTEATSVTTDNCESTSAEFDLQMILEKLHSRVDLSSCATSNQINVIRDNLLQGSLQAFKRRRFNPGARLDVVFVDSDGVGEGAVDEGGPTREYLRLLMREIQTSRIFEGPENNRLLALDTHALENGLYSTIGKMIAVCIIHGGVGPHFFSDRLFMQLFGKCTPPVSLEEIADRSFREKLLKIKDADSVQKSHATISDAVDCLSMMGALRYISSLEERDSLVQSAADYFVNGRTVLALRQFEEGLKTLGLLEEIKNRPEIFEDLFVNAVRPLGAKDLSTLFQVNFSPLGSNKRQLENKTICFWRDWLIDVEEGDCNPLTLEMVLEFASGASSVPPLGFPHQPQIEFLHEDGQEDRIFPEANTCLIVLRLPIHSTYESFRTYITEGILQSPTFGIM
ncbi:putative G2/M phase-specific E3 ubiquitin-protein ligase-like [Triplophysa rosa]|uniref:HECT-type E3 ubiquitin transferase n=1 Tax=Triplophysa rosa TaxID=992332 RepID=A0A9W7T4L3_TRIRA|nr:putative G2/M phase-specific E3 ubiquitin-protein ligase-like [Triplophysa rosa]